jgi:hypothetical protein
VPFIVVRFLPRRIAKRALCRAFFSQAHGKEGHTPFGSGAVGCFCLPCVVKKRTSKIIYRALSDVAHGKDTLPCKMLSCALCRAPRRKTHGKVFVVRFWAFVVRSWRTAKQRFPVVCRLIFFLLLTGQTQSRSHVELHVAVLPTYGAGGVRVPDDSRRPPSWRIQIASRLLADENRRI